MQFSRLREHLHILAHPKERTYKSVNPFLDGSGRPDDAIRSECGAEIKKSGGGGGMGVLILQNEKETVFTTNASVGESNPIYCCTAH